MSKKMASKEAVHAATDGLRAQGIEPTYDKVIEALGGGSNSSIGPHRETWGQSSQPPSRPIPEQIHAGAKILVEAVWSAALSATRADIEVAKLGSSARIDEAERALAASIEIGHVLEIDRNRLLDEVAAMGERCIAFRCRLRQVETLKVDLEVAECLVEQRREACEFLMRQLFALKSVNDTLLLQGQQLLEQVSMRARRPRNRVPKSRAHGIESRAACSFDRLMLAERRALPADTASQ